MAWLYLLLALAAFAVALKSTSVALSVICTLTSWGPSVVNWVVGVREVLSSKAPSSSVSQA